MEYGKGRNENWITKSTLQLLDRKISCSQSGIGKRRDKHYSPSSESESSRPFSLIFSINQSPTRLNTLFKTNITQQPTKYITQNSTTQSHSQFSTNSITHTKFVIYSIIYSICQPINQTPARFVHSITLWLNSTTHSNYFSHNITHSNWSSFQRFVLILLPRWSVCR